MTSWAGLRVLVLEADGRLAAELRSELGALGCDVSVLDDADAGLAHARGECPDVIVVSVELPGANGFAVCNKLKKDERTRDVPLILLSSEESEETFAQHRQLRTRAEAYLRKPFAFEQLRLEIEARVAHLGRELAARQAEGREGAGVPYRGAGVPATVPTGHKSEPTAVDRTWSVVSVLAVLTAALVGARSGLVNERLASGVESLACHEGFHRSYTQLAWLGDGQRRFHCVPRGGKDVVDVDAYLDGGVVGAVAGVVVVVLVGLIVRGCSSLLARARHGPG